MASVIKMNPIVTLTKFKDGTYAWSRGENLYGPMKFMEMVATGEWMFKIRKDEIVLGVNTLKIAGHDVVLYRNRYFESTHKIDYEGMKQE